LETKSQIHELSITHMPIRGSKLLGIARAPTLIAASFDDRCLETSLGKLFGGVDQSRASRAKDEVRVDPPTAGGGVIGKNTEYLNGRTEDHQ